MVFQKIFRKVYCLYNYKMKNTHYLQPGVSDGEVEGRVPPGPGVGTLVREEEVKLGAGGHRVLAQGVLTGQVVAHNAVKE